MNNLVILGSTGSIGVNALDVVRHMKGKFKVIGLSTHSNLKLLEKQVSEFKPQFVCVGEEKDAKELKEKVSGKCKVAHGIEGLEHLASLKHCDIVLISVVGAAALYPLISAIKSGKRIALANKEALVIAGELINKVISSKIAGEDRPNPAILPVDSEHSAIFQCLKNEDTKNIRKLIITGSGGPFYNKKTGFDKITIEQALKHPRWQMGRKITIDSATLMNKGLEIIEAHHLFNIPFKNIQLLIHPQSIVHSLVEFIDSATIGLMSVPNMKLSIQYALTYPDRFKTKMDYLQLEKIARLEFFEPDFSRFPCLKIAIEAGIAGHTLPAVLNAANEVAVDSFLNKKIRFPGIYKIIATVVSKHKLIKNPSLAEIIESDKWARSEAQQI